MILDEAQQFLKGHAWPGNVRELKNVMELAVLVHDEKIIRPADVHIEPYIPVDSAPEPLAPVSTPVAPAFAPVEASTAEHAAPPSSALIDKDNPLALISYRRVDPETERSHIVAALSRRPGTRAKPPSCSACRAGRS